MSTVSLHQSLVILDTMYMYIPVGVVCLLPAAGYNHLDVVEYLLESGADVNAKDKGGLIPLHNASSYGVGRSYPFLHCR